MMFLVPLTRDRFSLIDDEDADLLAFKWCCTTLSHTSYVYRSIWNHGDRKLLTATQKFLEGK